MSIKFLMTKKCACCLEYKESSDFVKNKNLSDGLHGYCKICNRLKNKKLRESNPDKEKLRHQKYKTDHPEKRALTIKNYYAKNTDKCSLASMRWSKNNKDKVKTIRRKSKKKHQYKCIENNAKRKALKKQQVLNLGKQDSLLIQAIYKEASFLTMSTGIKHHVDHIVPLVGKNMNGDHVVSGLHVSWNLQILVDSENQYKGNKFDGTYNNTSWLNSFNDLVY